MLCAIVNGIFISIPDRSLLVYSNGIDFYTPEIISWNLAKGHWN